MNDLVFYNEQRIISLYIPDGKISENINYKSIGLTEFKKILKRLEVHSLIENIKLKPKIYFAIILVDDIFFSYVS